MNDFTEKNLKKNCPHCDLGSYAPEYPLKETDNFSIVCDVHPLIEGHILIIPKKHLSCIGEYPEVFYHEFLTLFNEFSDFINKTYGTISAFEHGKIGQTVFHSHIHLLPWQGIPSQIIPEGEKYLTPFNNFEYLKSTYKTEGKYLYFSIAEKKWLVDPALGVPRFFRDRFAQVLGSPTRGNWKEMDHDKGTMQKATLEMLEIQRKWKLYSK